MLVHEGGGRRTHKGKEFHAGEVQDWTPPGAEKVAGNGGGLRPHRLQALGPDEGHNGSPVAGVRGRGGGEAQFRPGWGAGRIDFET